MVELGCDPLAANRWRFTGSLGQNITLLLDYSIQLNSGWLWIQKYNYYKTFCICYLHIYITIKYYSRNSSWCCSSSNSNVYYIQAYMPTNTNDPLRQEVPGVLRTAVSVSILNQGNKFSTFVPGSSTQRFTWLPCTQGRTP